MPFEIMFGRGVPADMAEGVKFAEGMKLTEMTEDAGASLQIIGNALFFAIALVDDGALRAMGAKVFAEQCRERVDQYRKMLESGAIVSRKSGPSLQTVDPASLKRA